MKNTEEWGKEAQWMRKTFQLEREVQCQRKGTEKKETERKRLKGRGERGNLRLILTMGRRKTPKVGFSKTNSICGGGGS